MLAAVGVAALESSAHLFICRPGWLQDDICIPFRCGSLPRPGRSRCTRAAQPRTSPATGPRTSPAGQALSPGRDPLLHKGSNPGRDLEGARKGEVTSSTAQMSHKRRSARTVFGVEEPAGPDARLGCNLCIPRLQVSPLTVPCCRWGCPAPHHSFWQARPVLEKARKHPFLLAGTSSQFFSV